MTITAFEIQAWCSGCCSEVGLESYEGLHGENVTANNQNANMSYGHRAGRVGASEQEGNTGRTRDRYHRPLVETYIQPRFSWSQNWTRHTRDRNAYTEDIPAMIIGYDTLAPVGGHLPLMLGSTLGAD